MEGGAVGYALPALAALEIVSPGRNLHASGATVDAVSSIGAAHDAGEAADNTSSSVLEQLHALCCRGDKIKGKFASAAAILEKE